MWIKPESGHFSNLNLDHVVHFTVRNAKYGDDNDRLAVYACLTGSRKVTEENAVEIWRIAINPPHEDDARADCSAVIDRILEEIGKGTKLFDISTLRGG